MQTRAIAHVTTLVGLVGLGCAVGSGGSTDGAGGSRASGTGVGGGSGANTAGTTGSAGATGSGGVGAGGTGGTGGPAGIGGATGGGGAAGAAAGGRSGSAGATGTGGGGAGIAGTGGAGGSDPCGASNPARVPLPTIGAGMFNVTSYGAVGDGNTDNTQMLQAALTAAAAAGGGTVVVPSGTFVSGPIVISSGTRLDLAAGAVLKLLPMASYPGSTAFITAASNAHDIALSGSGTIEGQGQAWWDAFAADATVARPQEVSLSHVTRLEISGLRFQNSPVEHIWVKQDTNVTITGITISTLPVAGKNPPKNTDGVDITTNGMFFCNNNITTGDDNVVMAGTNIYVAYSTLGLGHGCSIGSITQSGVSAVTVDHVTFNGTTAGVRMKSARDRGGLVQNLTYTNLTMTNVQTPVTIISYYPTLPTDPTVDTAMAVTATTPIWQNITIRNVTATGATNAGDLWGLPESKISSLVFDNVKIQAATGMRIFHAAGISFINGSAVTPRSGAAVTVFDATVSGITTTAF